MVGAFEFVLRVAVVLVVDVAVVQAVDHLLDGEVAVDLLAVIGCERVVDGNVWNDVCAFRCGRSF